MFASVYSSLLLFFLITTLTVSTMFDMKMSAEGLPVGRQEHGTDEDILAGQDFLSVFIESSLRGGYRETTTLPSEVTVPSFFEQDSTDSLVRASRETSSVKEEEFTEPSQRQFSLGTSDSSLSGVIVGVSESSSVDVKVGNSKTNEDSNLPEITTQLSDVNLVPSKELPSIVSKSSKSELSVEESEPITSQDRVLHSSEYDFPASVQALPNSQHISFNPTSYIREANKNKLPPFHHSVIFHDTPKQGTKPRSVSYSTVIQAIPHTEKIPLAHERRERNYDGAGAPYLNSLEDTKQKNDTKSNTQDNNSYLAPSSTPSSQENWQIPEGNLDTKPNTPNLYEPPSHTSTIYGRPEQNYEVDEAVSVVSNGRAHGIQPRPFTTEKTDKDSSGKRDDNQKVGYVVEGRNYRKYRVEERTSDGFIVGEYGVVSHDDGSLRGVRYTADGTINPRLIYDALMKFLSL